MSDPELKLPPLEKLVAFPKWRLQWSRAIETNSKVNHKQKLGCIVPINTDGSEDKANAIEFRSPLRGWIREVIRVNNALITPADAEGLLLKLTLTNLCKHEVVLNGLCADCGTDLGPNYTHQTSKPSEQMIKLGFVSADTDIRVSKEVAQTLTSGKVASLLKKRRLILVLDLDNTLAHADQHPPPPDLLREDARDCYVDYSDEVAREMAVWPSHTTSKFEQVAVIDFCSPDARQLLQKFRIGVKDPVGAHYLDKAEDDPRAGPHIRTLEKQLFVLNTAVHFERTDGTSVMAYQKSWFKLRPGVIRFLREMSVFFELYLYTAGTMEHAESALKLLDPERRFFEDRVFARKALSGDGTKSLGQILPTDHEMIVVIDDTRRVWADDVALLMCYPYMWHKDDSLHFLYPYRVHGEAYIKYRAVRDTVGQYSPKNIRGLNRMIEAWNKERRPLPEAPPIAETVAGDLEASETRQKNASADNMTEEVSRDVQEHMTEESSRPTEDEDMLERRPARGRTLYADLQNTWVKLGLEERLSKPCPAHVLDTDLQMDNCCSVLRALHYTFFQVIQNQSHEDTICIPSSKDILQLLRKQVLQGCRILYAGPADFKNTDLYQLTVASGATVIFNDDLQLPTHVVVPSKPPELPPPSAKYHLVDISWLECAVCCLIRPPEAAFHPKEAVKRRVFWDVCKLRSQRKDIYEEERREPRAKRRRTSSATEDGIRVDFNGVKRVSDQTLDKFTQVVLTTGTSFKSRNLVFEGCLPFSDDIDDLADEFIAELKRDKADDEDDTTPQSTP